jgi:hypothetical protein
MFILQRDAYPEAFRTLAHAGTLTKTLIGHHESTTMNSLLAVRCELVPTHRQLPTFGAHFTQRNKRKKITLFSRKAGHC